MNQGQESFEFRRRRRVKNLAMLVGLLGLAAIFFGVTVVKMDALGGRFTGSGNSLPKISKERGP